MNQQRWQQIETLIEETWALESMEEKRACIKHACQNDKRLYHDVILLLQAMQDAEEEQFLE